MALAALMKPQRRMKRGLLSRQRNGPVRTVGLSKCDGDSVTGTARTIEHGPLENARTLNQEDGGVGVVRNVAYTLHYMHHRELSATEDLGCPPRQEGP